MLHNLYVSQNIIVQINQEEQDTEVLVHVERRGYEKWFKIYPQGMRPSGI
jgi:hypothetical protein